MDTNSDVNRDVKSSTDEELIQLFGIMKETFKQLNEENVRLKQNIEYKEENKEWNQRFVHRLTDQLNDYKNCCQTQQNTLKSLKETNEDLNSKLSEMRISLKTTEELNEEIKSDINSEVMKLKNELKEKDKELNELRLNFNTKDIHFNEMKRQLNENNTKCEEINKEFENMFEMKIKSLYKEFDLKTEAIHQSNDQKIIEIKANCLRSIEKTKEEYESKLFECQRSYEDLKEKYSELRLVSEARKMNNPYLNTSRSVSKTKSSTNTAKETKTRLSIQILDSDIEELKPTVQLAPNVPKRKKLNEMNDSYLEFISEEP